MRVVALAISQDDLKDLLKTMVAFANSVRPGHVATILFGERKDGTPEGLADANEIQRKVRQCADHAQKRTLRMARSV